MTILNPNSNRSMQLYGVLTVFAVAIIALMFAATSPAQTASASSTVSYPLVDTGQTACYDDDGAEITCPAEGEAFYGQDAQFSSNDFSFTDNGDGTVTDGVTNLMWQQTPSNTTYSWQGAVDACEALELADHDDWHLPSLKELFSISNFSQGWPYLDTTYFDLVDSNEVTKDEQYWADNYYAGTTVEGGADAAFGVNHATGHIKAYAAQVGGPRGKYARCVRGDDYGVNQLVDNGGSTITDEATGLMWMQDDSGEGLDWENALALAEEKNAETYLGYSDWRLPDVKELQSIVDYSRAPDATSAANEGPALDPLFNVSTITNEAGNADYPYYWSSTSALFQSGGDYYYAWYVAAGRAVNGEGLDFHGAGAVRFDTKVEGGPAGEDPERVYNYVRLVRDTETVAPPELTENIFLPIISNAEVESATTASIEVNTERNVAASEFVAMPETMAEASQVNGSEISAPDIVAPESDASEFNEEMEQPNPSGQMPDLTTIAADLGVTEDALQAALGEPGQGPPVFATAAAELGVTEDALLEALGISAGTMPMGGPANDQQPSGGQPPMGRP